VTESKYCASDARVPCFVSRGARGKILLRFGCDNGSVKVFLISIAVLMGADAALNHGNVTKAVFHGVIGAFHGTGGAVSDSIFSK
jgi:hypothetical protein